MTSELSITAPCVNSEHRAANHNRQQVSMIGTLYVAYAMSMVLRMVPTVAGNAIRSETALGVDVKTWAVIMSTGTVGAMIGKFFCGWAADTFGGRKTFSVALFIASLFVGMFALSSSVLMFQVTFFVVLMAQAAGWPSMTKIIVNWIPPERYGRAWGILSTSSRVGTLTATLLLGSTLAWISWRNMLWIASGSGIVIALFYGLRMKDRPDVPVQSDEIDDSNASRAAAHPFDNLTLLQALPRFVGSLRFWLICGSLMGLTILWDFLLYVPLYLKDTAGLDDAAASQVASAFPFGSLISVLIGGFVFDRLPRRTVARLMAGLLLGATGCLVAFVFMPQWHLSGTMVKLISVGLLFLFGLFVSPCYYIPASVFSIDFGGRHSGFLVAILDAAGFAATAVFYVQAGKLPETSGWTTFLIVLCVAGLWSLVTTFLFMRREARNRDRRLLAAGRNCSEVFAATSENIEVCKSLRV
jgi:MFS transporter, OPA family, sugar phosphate sensor protein UhpC